MTTVQAAAANNAAWCDIVCRTHGLGTRTETDAWTVATRSPTYYPDAVTLVPDASVDGLLDRIDGSAGCSIKDSFASLDLVPFGFRVLFEATWVARTATPGKSADPTWDVVRERDAFAAWERAWRADDHPADVLRPALLDHADVCIVVRRGGDDAVTAGAVLHTTGRVVGLSNVFGRWGGCLGLAAVLFPEATVVGYERDGARSSDAADIGPLRVWIRE